MPSTSELAKQIDQAMGADRHRFRQRLRSIQSAKKQRTPFDRNLKRFSEELAQSIERRASRAKSVPRIEYDAELPVAQRRVEIAEAIRDNPVVIVCGETGSGKSTQLPKICLELGRGVDGVIGHTQPRRIAARSVAARVAEELGGPLGRDVGFKIRFTDSTSSATYIKLMTDGILLAELQHDRYLNQYDTIIIDEVHERSLNIDFLLGYARQLLETRRDLKLIITSATVDAAALAEHFTIRGKPAPVIEVTGRTYPVEVRYRPLVGDEDEEDVDWQQGILNAVDELTESDDGDILIFMPTERDIHELAKRLRGRNFRGRTTEILPLYARLSAKDQNRIFAAHSQRRIVIATNVAESSLTVPGIRSVIDPGLARMARYSARSKVQRLPIEPVSQASAEQRKGRCGRIGPGICIRLYSEADFLSRDRYTAPEIQRTNLASVILQTKAMRFGEIEDFPFIDPPKPTTIRDGYKTLFELGAIDAEQNLTELGRKLSRLPVDPRIGRMILAGHAENALHEVLIIAAALEIQDPRERPLEHQQAADEAHSQFADENSDFLSYLNLWDFYRDLKDRLSQSQLRRACRQNFLSYNRMREWSDLHRQLLEIVERSKLKPEHRRDDSDAIHRALLAGLLSNIAYRPEGFEYSGAGGGKFFLWPGSSLFKKKPKWIVAAELVETTKRYLRTVARINPDWIEPLAGHLVNRTYSEPRWSRERGSTMAFERVSLYGLTIVPKRGVQYGGINPETARELFIQHGLVEGDLDTTAAFFKHNQELLEELEGLQSKSRRYDFLVGEEARFDFYDTRIPADVFDAVRLKQWCKKESERSSRLLYMEKSDLVADATEDVESADFPDVLTIESMRLPVSYHLEPGSAEDGVTLTVPQEGLGHVPPQLLGWLVPGLLEEKVTAIIKSLPKSKRRMLVPAPETAREVAQQIEYGRGSFNNVVAGHLSRIAGERISPREFDLDKLPNHLRMNVRVVDAEQQQLAIGRDLSQLRDELGREQAAAVVNVLDDPQWNREGITTWDFGELPEKIGLERGGVKLKAFPGLVDAGESVTLRLFDSKSQAKHATLVGVRRLFVLAEQRRLQSQVAHLPAIDRVTLLAATLPDSGRFREQLAELIAARALGAVSGIPRSEQEFRKAMQLGQNRITVGVQDVAKVIRPLIQGCHDVRVALEGKKNAQWSAAANDMKEQLSCLTQPGFLTQTPWSWLQQYPRYFAAMRVRLEKLATGGIERDRQSSAELTSRWRRCVERMEQLSPSGVHDAELVHYRWMLEEFRVSLFAQQLGTAVSVSPQRLDKQWGKVGG